MTFLASALSSSWSGSATRAASLVTSYAPRMSDSQAGVADDPYIVVSADAHAAPDDLDHFLSYVDPADRDEVAAFGDLSSTAMVMLGGHDPGEIDDPDPVRAVAARRLAGMGVDIEAATGWLERYSTDWVFAGDGDGRRLAVLEEQGIHAEVTYPGPVLTGGISPAMYLGAVTADGLDAVWPALHGYNRWLADFCAAAPGRRAGVIPIDLHDLDRAIEELGWARNNGIFGGVMLPAMSVRSKLPGYADDVLRAVLERVRGTRHRRQPPHRRVRHRHRCEVPARRGERWPARAVRGVRVHPPAVVVPDLRRCLRPASELARSWWPRTACSGFPHWSATWSSSSTRTAVHRCGPTSRPGRRTTSNDTSISPVR